MLWDECDLNVSVKCYGVMVRDEKDGMTWNSCKHVNILDYFYVFDQLIHYLFRFLQVVINLLKPSGNFTYDQV
jgi:hypothetical protein